MTEEEDSYDDDFEELEEPSKIDKSKGQLIKELATMQKRLSCQSIRENFLCL